MVEGPTKVLRVFRALLYTYTMPNHHYTSTYMLAYHHLKSPKVKTKLLPEATKTPTVEKACGKTHIQCQTTTTLTHLREEKRQRLAVKVWWRALQRC